MSRVKHYVDSMVMHKRKSKQDFENALKLKGFVSQRYIDICKWFEVVVDYKSECDEAIRLLASNSRKEP